MSHQCGLRARMDGNFRYWSGIIGKVMPRNRVSPRGNESELSPIRWPDFDERVFAKKQAELCL